MNWIYEKTMPTKVSTKSRQGSCIYLGHYPWFFEWFHLCYSFAKEGMKAAFLISAFRFFSFSGGKLLWQFGTAILSDVALAREFQISRRRFRHCDWIEDLTCCIPHFWTGDWFQIGAVVTCQTTLSIGRIKSGCTFKLLANGLGRCCWCSHCLPIWSWVHWAFLRL